jgi:hypothetical protein
LQHTYLLNTLPIFDCRFLIGVCDSDNRQSAIGNALFVPQRH